MLGMYPDRKGGAAKLASYGCSMAFFPLSFHLLFFSLSPPFPPFSRIPFLPYKSGMFSGVALGRLRGAPRSRPADVGPVTVTDIAPHWIASRNFPIRQLGFRASSLDAIAAMNFPRGRRGPFALIPLLFLAFILLAGPATASVGDRLPEFRECVAVRVPRSTAPYFRTARRNNLALYTPD